jgi:hypothetical protein
MLCLCNREIQKILASPALRQSVEAVPPSPVLKCRGPWRRRACRGPRRAPADARPGPDHPWADLRAIGHRGLAQDTQDGSCDGREAPRDGRHRGQLHLCPEQAAGLLRRHIISILSR